MNIRTLFTMISLLLVMALAACKPQIVHVPVTVVVSATPIPNFNPAFDPIGDTSLTGVDIIGNSATVFAAGPSLWADLRLQFAAAPFGQSEHEIKWCFNTDQNAASGGACDSDSPFGTEWRLTLRGSPNALTGNNDFAFDLNQTGYHACMHGAFDWATNTLRLLIPVPWFADDGQFNYAVVSAMTDGGATDFAPDTINFSTTGGYFQSQNLAEPLPFVGVPLCGLEK